MTTKEQATKYIEDPKTRVYISHSDEIGEWRYSIVVENSGAFWLDSFKTEEEANKFVLDNQLKLTQK